MEGKRPLWRARGTPLRKAGCSVQAAGRGLVRCFVKKEDRDQCPV